MKYSYEIENNLLTIYVEQREKCRYAAYLLLNGQVVEKQFYRNKAKFDFTLGEEGNYRVLLYEKTVEEEIVTEETEEIIYKKKIQIGTFKNIFYETKDVVMKELPNSFGSICAAKMENCGDYEAILIDLKDEIGCIRNEYGDLSGLVKCKEGELALFRKYFALGRQLEEKYKGVFILVDRFGGENEAYFEEEEFYVSEIVYAALRQTLYRTYAISGRYQERLDDIIKRSCDKIRSFVTQKELDFDVLLHGQENILEAEIVANIEPGDQFFFYLIRDGRVVVNSGWMSQNKYQWVVKETGVYCVQGYIKRNGYKSIRKSLPIYWTTEDDKKKYEDFLQGEIGEARELPYYDAEEPYCDFAVVTMSKKADWNDSVLKIDGTKLRIIHQSECDDMKMQVITNGVPCETEKGYLLFSGECIIGESYISGEQDKKVLVKYSEKLPDAIGTFTALEVSGGACKIFTDYFGFGRIFYMQAEDIAIVSNRYDLILRIMRNMEAKRELYVDKVKVLLSTVSVQILQQNIVREMNIRGIMQLLPEESMEWSDGKWTKGRSSLGKNIAELPIFHMCNYKKNLCTVAEEIKKNVGILLKDERFENIITDLTGGLDSRVVYAALTNFRGTHDKVRINAQDTPGSKDLEIAMKINGMYKFSWDDLKEEWEEIDAGDINEKQRSVFVGTYYAYGRNNREIRSAKRIRLSGGGGDFIARPLYSRKYFETLAGKLKNEERFMQYIESDYAANLIIDGSDFRAFNDMLANELKSNPMDYMTTLEKFNYLYFAYRNGFHFHNIFAQKCNIPLFMPILSKQLYILNLQTHNLFQSVRLQIDVIETLNPLLACIPFDGKTDEEDRKKKKAEEYLNPIYSFEEMELCTDYEKWQSSQMKKAENREVIRKHNKNIAPEEELETLYSNLRRLVALCPELKGVGEALFYWIKNNEKKPRNILFLSNKIQSILDEIV